MPLSSTKPDTKSNKKGLEIVPNGYHFMSGTLHTFDELMGSVKINMNSPKKQVGEANFCHCTKWNTLR